MQHPLIRIVALLAFAAALVGRAPPTLLAAAALAWGANALHGRGTLARCAALARRARWLLLAVGAFTAYALPGAPLWPGAPAWTPSAEGAWLAVGRVALLLALSAAASLLLATSSRAELVAGIAAACRPLAPLGLEPARVAARAGGALERLGATESALRGAGRDWAGAAAAEVLRIEAEARAATPVATPPLAPPPRLAWAWPLGLLALGGLLGSRGL